MWFKSFKIFLSVFLYLYYSMFVHLLFYFLNSFSVSFIFVIIQSLFFIQFQFKLLLKDDFKHRDYYFLSNVWLDFFDRNKFWKIKFFSRTEMLWSSTTLNEKQLLYNTGPDCLQIILKIKYKYSSTYWSTLVFIGLTVKLNFLTFRISSVSVCVWERKRERKKISLNTFCCQ